jgi:Amt family ammonium transporter
VLDLIMGLRVSEEVEITGLDIHETGLECYPEFKKA